jgi:hypothetical protein
MSFCATILGLLVSPSVGSAQLRADSTSKDLKRMVGDIWSIWTSPAHMTPRDARGLAAAAAITGAAATADERFYRWAVDHPDAWPIRILHPLREAGRYPVYELGSGQYLLPLSGALYLAGSASHSRALHDAGLGCATAHLTSAGAREIAYLLVSRDRPRLSPADAFRFHVPGTRDWNAHSFFSGHIANSMGCASFFAHRFKLQAAEPVLYSLVLAIGIGRVLDGRHWLSDTSVGALFGYAAGRAINARMTARERAVSAAQTPPLAVSFSVAF